MKELSSWIPTIQDHRKLLISSGRIRHLYSNSPEPEPKTTFITVVPEIFARASPPKTNCLATIEIVIPAPSPSALLFRDMMGVCIILNEIAFWNSLLRRPLARYWRVLSMTLKFLTLPVRILSHLKDPSGCKVCYLNQIACGITSNATGDRRAVQNLSWWSVYLYQMD